MVSNTKHSLYNIHWVWKCIENNSDQSPSCQTVVRLAPAAPPGMKELRTCIRYSIKDCVLGDTLECCRRKTITNPVICGDILISIPGLVWNYDKTEYRFQRNNYCTSIEGIVEHRCLTDWIGTILLLLSFMRIWPSVVQQSLMIFCFWPFWLSIRDTAYFWKCRLWYSQYHLLSRHRHPGRHQQHRHPIHQPRR